MRIHQRDIDRRIGSAHAFIGGDRAAVARFVIDTLIDGVEIVPVDPMDDERADALAELRQHRLSYAYSGRIV